MTGGMAGHTKHSWVAVWPSRLLELESRAGGDSGCRLGWGWLSPGCSLPHPGADVGAGDGSVCPCMLNGPQCAAAPCGLIPLKRLKVPMVPGRNSRGDCCVQLFLLLAINLCASSSSLHPIRLIAAN